MSEQIQNLFWVWNCEMRQLSAWFAPIIAVPAARCSLAFAALLPLYTSVNPASLCNAKAWVLFIWPGIGHFWFCLQNPFSRMIPRELLCLLLHLISLQHKLWLCLICMSSVLSLCFALNKILSFLSPTSKFHLAIKLKRAKSCTPNCRYSPVVNSDMVLIAQVWYPGPDPENVRGKKWENQSFQETGVVKGAEKKEIVLLLWFF